MRHERQLRSRSGLLSVGHTSTLRRTQAPSNLRKITVADDDDLDGPDGPTGSFDLDNMGDGDFSERQERHIQDMIAQAVASAIRAGRDELRNQPAPHGLAATTTTSGHFRPQEIGFFHPDYKARDAADRNVDMVTVGGDTFIRSVYVFIDRAKDTVLTRGEDTVKANIATCLRGAALSWYTSALSDLEKRALRAPNEPLSTFLDLLAKQFAPSLTQSLNKLTATRYSMQDAYNYRSLTQYVMDVVNAGKAAQLPIRNQLIFAFQGIEPGLRHNMKGPAAENMSLQDLCQSLEEQRDAWHDIAATHLGGMRAANRAGPVQRQGQYGSPGQSGQNSRNYMQSRPPFGQPSQYFQPPSQPKPPYTPYI